MVSAALTFFLSILVVQAQVVADVNHDVLPSTAEDAINECERLEYTQPQEATRIAELSLAGEAELTPRERGLLKACQAWATMQLGQMSAARAITEDVAELATSLSDPAGRLDRLIRLASLEYRGGDSVSALEVMETALELTETHDLKDKLPAVLGNLANYLTESGQYTAAIEHFERILSLPRSEGTPPNSEMRLRYNFTRTLMMDGQHERALEQLEILIPMLQRPGLEPRLATALSMSGNAWRRLGDLQRARALTDQAAALHESFDNPAERSVLRRDQAMLARELGELESAERYIRDSLRLAEEIEFERIILDAQINLVEILEARGRLQEALDLHREYAERNISFLEAAQRSRLDALETELGMQRQAQELYELRQTAEIQSLQLAEESLRRRVAFVALIAVLILAVGLTLWQRRNQKRLLETSRTDSLTGLANRRYLTLQMQTHDSDPQQAALLLLDLDHFKEINDRHGHDVGDRALVAVSRLLDRLSSEHGAVCGRWGGEEFAVYLPAASRHKTLALAEALRRGIAELELRDNAGKRIEVTASIGFAPIAGFERDSGSEVWEPAMKAADQLLYQAKNEGRNRGLGAWPKPGDAPIDPLALSNAMDADALYLLFIE